MRLDRKNIVLVCCCSAFIVVQSIPRRGLAAGEPSHHLKLSWADEYLTIRGSALPGSRILVHYLEAYCRDGSTDRAWEDTVIGHHTKLIAAAPDGHELKLRSTLDDGVIVEHQITTRRVDDKADAVDFHVVAANPTNKDSRAIWAQPCIRVDKFTGLTQQTYLPHCFVYINGRLTRLPTIPWATKARYNPGQVYCPAGVNRNDVNPRPLSPLVPSNGLIGCFSGDEREIMGVAWQPYQELFQGVGVCIHSDFRIGGLHPGEMKRIRGTMYFTSAGPEALLKQYEMDYPEQTTPCAN
ncbi:MAG TPA: hypothetical protein VHE81_05485 [Lacipirellulaceae bacterium]|nr:hypothetical protein [Lacipirellulaceae bacterium]